MKRRIIIIIASVAIVWISILTVALTNSYKTLDSTKEAVARTSYYALRELDDALDRLIMAHEGTLDYTTNHAEELALALGRLDSAFDSAISLCGYGTDKRYDALGNFGFIASCLSSNYSANINGERFDGILYDGELSDGELEYIRLMQVELDELRAAMTLGDGLNFNPDVTLDDIYPMLIEFVDKFALGYESDAPIMLLFED